MLQFEHWSELKSKWNYESFMLKSKFVHLVWLCHLSQVHTSTFNVWHTPKQHDSHFPPQQLHFPKEKLPTTHLCNVHVPAEWLLTLSNNRLLFSHKETRSSSSFKSQYLLLLHLRNTSCSSLLLQWRTETFPTFSLVISVCTRITSDGHISYMNTNMHHQMFSVSPR